MKSKAGDQQCPCFQECRDCTTGFQKVVDLNNAGLVIYRHKIETKDVNKYTGKTEFATKTTEDVFILHNTKDVDITSADVLEEIEQNRLNCPRCRRMVDYAQKVLQKIPTINRNDVKGICEHCKMKDASCFECEEVVKKFIASKTKYTENTKEKVKLWLSKIKYLLKDVMIDETETGYERARAYSELHIDQLCRRASPEVSREPVDLQMFHPAHCSDFVGAFPHSIEKRKKMFIQFPQLENLERPLVCIDSSRKGKKSLSFKTEAIYKADQEHYYSDPDSEDLRAMFFSPGTKENAEKQKIDKHVEYVPPVPIHSKEDFVLCGKSLYALNEEPYPDLRPDRDQRRELNKKLSLGESKAEKQNYELPVVVRKYHSEEALLTTVGGVTKDMLKQGFTYFFPKALLPDTTFKRQKSSSELIKDTQDMLLARAVQDKKRLEDDVKKRVEEGKKTQEEKEKKGVEEKKKQEKEKKGIPQQAKNKADEEKKLLKVKTDKEMPRKIKTTPTASTATSKSQSVSEKKASKPTTGRQPESKKPKPMKEQKVGKDGFKSEKDEDKARKEIQKKEKDAQLKRDKEEKERLKKEKAEQLRKDKEHKQKEKDEQLCKDKLLKQKEKDEKLRKDKENVFTVSGRQPESNKPKPMKEQKVGKDGFKAEKDEDKARKEIEKKEKDAQLKRDKEEKERLKKEKAEQLRKDKEHKQKEKDEQLRKDKELKQNDKDSSSHYAKDDQARLRAEKEAADKKAREDAMLQLKTARDHDADNKIDPPKLTPKKIQVPTTKELNIKEVKIRESSFVADNLILDLVKMRQVGARERPKRLLDLNLSPKQVKNHFDYHKLKRQACIACNDSELELDAESIFFRENEDLMADIIVGEKIYKYKQPLMENQDGPVEQIVPLVFRSTFDDALPTAAGLLEDTKISRREKNSPKCTNQESQSGVIRYALSNRSFIEKGWTMLPTEKVVRKMNVYRMRPAHPEFDWFEHNKNKRLMSYDSGEKLAEFDDNGRGRWFYRSGRLALDYYDAEETNAQQRFVIYSSGEPDERGRSQPFTILATFDYLGNGVVFDHAGKIRLKYNQTEGVVLDRSIGPVSHWKWHTLNDPPVLQQVMIDTELTHKDPEIMKLGGPQDIKTRPDNEDMLAIEFENFVKEKSKKLSQTFKPFQIKMKALKINEHFSLRVLDQATVYLIFRDGTTNLKLNIGMVLDHKEIVDTDTAEIGNVSSNVEQLPARTDSLARLQESVAHAQYYERNRTERERRLRPPEPCASADKLTAAASRPLRPALRTGPSSTSANCRCSRKPTTTNVYYDTRLF